MAEASFTLESFVARSSKTLSKQKPIFFFNSPCSHLRVLSLVAKCLLFQTELSIFVPIDFNAHFLLKRQLSNPSLAALHTFYLKNT